ncbi:hypothetical protein [Phyllobacterium leguminum]|uniref:Uncharacterized protein n=1 Tax=Phyllobacterium leguminum TaxID=314237 RepID=A0A318T3Z6_9HYPH|nr:hypothetical protein [Phyllobacterium leguminum]PYE88773.1 hypothetical protein C7477_106146 [Phyllobacterium leguminum]
MTKAMKEAARWLATTPDAAKPHPIIPHLRKQFGLSPVEAVRAITESHLIKARAS